MIKQPEVTIGLIRFNSPEDELECLNSIINNVDIKYDLIVYNNDESGHSAGVNKIVEMAQTPYVLVVTGDCLISKNSVEKLLNAIKYSEKTVSVGPVTSKSTPSQQVNFANKYKEIVNKDNVNLMSEIIKPLLPEKNVITTFVNGFCFMVNKELFTELGGFPLDVPNYGNEQVFAKKVEQAGFHSIIVPTAYIHHYGERSIRKFVNYDEKEYQKMRMAGDLSLVKLNIQPKSVLEKYGNLENGKE